jgi:two-component system sensor histidine kinase ChiS
MKLTVPVTDAVFGLKIRSIRMAHQLFINGKLVGGSGLPAIGIEAHRPGNTPYTAFFHTASREVEIVIQVSNYVFVTGGIVNSIPFGLHEDMTRQTGIQLGTDIAIICILGMFCAYHLSLYFLGRREKTYLLSGLYLLILVVQKSLFGEKILQRTLPDLPFDIAYKLLALSEFVNAGVIILFLCTVDGVTSRNGKNRTLSNSLHEKTGPFILQRNPVFIIG